MSPPGHPSSLLGHKSRDATHAILLLALLASASVAVRDNVAAGPPTFYVRISVQITDPTQSIPITFQLQQVDARPPGTYEWWTFVNYGYVTPDRMMGSLPVSQVSLTYFPGTAPIDYSSVCVRLVIRYSPESGSGSLHQYDITFSPSYRVDVVSERGTTPGSSFYQAGAFLVPSVTPNEIPLSESERYCLAGWSVEVSGRPPYSIGPTDSVCVSQVTTIGALWQMRYLVRFSGPTNTTESWHPQGSRVTFSSPQSIEYSPGRRKVLDGYNAGGTFVTGTTLSLTVSSPIDVSALYHDEFYVQAVSERGTVSGSGWYRSGATVSPSVTPTIINDTTASRWTFKAWNSSLPIIVNGPVTLVACWVREYKVEVDTHSGGRIVDGWYTSGTAIRIEASPPIDLGNGTMSAFSGWSDGGTAPDRRIIIEAPVSLKETRALYYSVVVTPSDPVVSLSGESFQAGWFRAGTSLLVAAPEEANLSAGVKLVFDGFLEPVETSERTITIVLRGPTQVRLQWARYFFVEVDGGHAEADGTGWYREGTEVRPRISKGVVYDSDTARWSFAGWDPNAPILARGPTTIRAAWTREYLVTVSSPLGSVSGGGWYEEGSTACLSVQPRALTLANGSLATFRFWLVNRLKAGSDSLLVDGSKDCIAVWELSSPSQDESILPRPETNETAHVAPDYGNQSHLEGSTSHPHAFELIVSTEHSTCSGGGRYAEGGSATIRVEELTVAVSPVERFRFIGWVSHDGELMSSSQTFNVTVDRDMTIRALWLREFQLSGSWFPENTSILLCARPDVFSEGGGTVERFHGWILQNGSEVYCEELVLPAREAIHCHERRMTYHLVTFRVQGIGSVSVRIIDGDDQELVTAMDGTFIWCPSGSVLVIDMPDGENIAGVQEDNAINENRINIGAGPIEVRVLYPTVAFSEHVGKDALEGGPFSLESLPLLCVTILIPVAFVALRRLNGVKLYIGSRMTRKAASAGWMSIEEYLRQARKMSKKRRP